VVTLLVRPTNLLKVDREDVMKRHVLAGLAVVAVAAGVGWRVGSHPANAAGLQEISINQQSEHSNPGPSDALARIRIRVSATDFDVSRAATDKVPQIHVAAE
jgi:hypothetical protein